MDIESINRRHFTEIDMYYRVSYGVSSKLISYTKGIFVLEVVIGHKWNSVIIHLLSARADKRLIDVDFGQTSTETPTPPAAPPSLYIFNYEVPIDILEEKEFVGDCCSVLSLACNGTTTWWLSYGLEEAGHSLTSVSRTSQRTGRIGPAGHLL